jgi:hypothetical protein
VAFVLKRVQRVVHHEAMAKHIVIVREGGREPERNRVEARRLRSQIRARRVGTAHNDGKPRHAQIIDLILLDKRIKTAQLPDVGQFNSRRSERDTGLIPNSGSHSGDRIRRPHHIRLPNAKLE